MPDETPAGTPVPQTQAGRFRHHEIRQADGSRLVLAGDGRIDHLDAEGAAIASWAPDDLEWPRVALRFGLRPQPGTVAPHRPGPGGPDRPW